MTSKFEEIERKNRDIPLILKLDAGGNAVSWIHWEEAATLKFNDKIVWEIGEKIELRGGFNRIGERSTMDLSTIIACNDQSAKRRKTPVLTNTTLFRRDRSMCMYCSHDFPHYKLTRDHVIPTSRGGANIWTNCVTACRRCNHKKADRTPEEANMQLIAIPFAPSRDEFLILQNRRILGCQMDFLKTKASDLFKTRFQIQ